MELKEILVQDRYQKNQSLCSSPFQGILRFHKLEDQVKEIYQKCKQQNKTLVIRDFTFIDFTPHQLNKFNPKKVFSKLC